MQLDSLSAWLKWLEQNHTQEIDLGLDRVSCVAARMGLLNPSGKVVTVAGTNGKGSCVTATAALLSAAGFSVGVYTSPHLIHYNERIVVNGSYADDKEICDAFSAIYNACQQISDNSPQPISLTYFEYGTLAALEIFSRHAVDVMVLEVGLGGRLDAVNIIDADVAIITTVALDHTDWLGDNREAIGYEKAGIIRAGKPVVCADFDPPLSLINHSLILSAPLYLINRDFGYSTEDASWGWWNLDIRFSSNPLPQLPLPSLAAALQAVLLLGVDVKDIDAFAVLADLRVPGRFQTKDWNQRVVILDVAHNPAATLYLAERLAQAASSSSQVHAIVAMMSDKDRAQSLGNLKNCVSHWYLADLSYIPRAASVLQLRQDLHEHARSDVFSGSVADCLQMALKNSAPGDRILICGSFFTVAAAIQALDMATP
ncbi:bifunctional tetrahydrofolate synthase/dihydrofolate synthase [Cellvibrio sp. pealriver]|uniref:bifunctional tetrahydrofolate synthase/dihydrofolate synthase n=1 Tax=Cellvibrio sp. pealriver TaxID=1622269 RepID=UPI00066FD897|nr:bifunctional tetrahydrofolate synthase/dihydrofolate synthase [Cellvibrio sp. pealriver]